MKDQRGFVLVDAIIGVLILCIGVTFLINAASGARHILYLSQWRLKAANAAATELEQLQSKDLQALVANKELLPGEIVAKIKDDIELQVESQWVNQVTGLLRLKVTANWQYGPGSGNVVYETMLNRGSE
jgi:hypothetical protein